MSISTQLFEGTLIRLGSLDSEQDANIEALWTHEPGFMRLMYTEPMRPLSVFQVKKKHEALEKEMEQEKNLFHFRFRTLTDDRLIGFGELRDISWSTLGGQIRLGIGSPQDWRKGYGSEALQLLLRYAFAEINLYRLTAVIPEYNQAAIRLFEKAGFTLEVRRRQALARDTRRWDALHYGLLAGEWKS
ncbi:MAG TPA: GNAT family protein [Anaerolineales bacterium]